MSFIKNFLGKEAHGVIEETDIDNFISKQIEENLHLDYKDIEAFEDPDKLAKHISSMANSDGGLIILGVSERKSGRGGTQKIFPDKITWGDISITKETLEQKILSRISYIIEDVIIIPVRNPTNDKVIFLIEVPQSVRAPHMAPDNRYYRRHNFQKLPMEHYEVADLFGKRFRPDLELKCSLGRITRRHNQCNIRFEIINRGRAIAKFPAIIIEPLMCNLSYAQFLIEVEYHEYEVRGIVRKGTFRKNIGVFYPDVEERMGEIQTNLNEDVNCLELKIEIAAEGMPLKTYYIIET